MVWSEAGVGPRTSQQIVQELHTLLGKAGVRAPYVLVAHSLGGIHMQLYASQYPHEVAGMVLVDSSHEQQFSRQDMAQIPSFLPLLIKALTPFGVARVVNTLAAPAPNLPPDMKTERAAIYSHTRSMYAAADEMSAIPVSAQQLRAAPMQMGDKPLLVLTRGMKESSPFSSPEEADRMEQAWRELQADLASRSSNGKQIIAERSGHFIQFYQPELVIDAIHQVVAAARQPRV
jgi:pimeloyl-ACP methyl ester carboxylesterase